jgi:hypothetical protein
MNREPHDELNRLPANYYRGSAWVHWVMTIARRRTGWLDGAMHFGVREAMLHTFARYRRVCPMYVLMPDHAHLVWCGCSLESDQRKASSFFRRQWNERLKVIGFQLQKQPYEHVLRDQERDLRAFEETCVYVMKNPEQAGLVNSWRDWVFGGALIAGFPWVDPRERDYWRKFWTAYNSMREPETM